MKDITLKPRMSEKAYATSTNSNVYVFVVPNNATKQSIVRAVEAQFSVTVENVRTLVQNGKAMRSRSKRSRGVTVYRNSIKKAYVTVKAGDHIAIFDAPEEVKADKTTAKLVEKAAKKEAKETKTTSKITRSSDKKAEKK